MCAVVTVVDCCLFNVGCRPLLLISCCVLCDVAAGECGYLLVVGCMLLFRCVLFVVRCVGHVVC